MTETPEKSAVFQSMSLIVSSREGNEQAYGRLVGIWFKRIYNFSLKYFGDHDMAMEVTQQTFIVVYQKIHTLKEIDRFQFWLYRIALNHCREEDRKRKKKKWYSLIANDDVSMQESDIGNPESEYGSKETTELMTELLKQLPEEQKTVIIMKEFEGLKFREISDILNISENTAKSRLYYGLKALKKLVEKSELNYKI
jgi:RNA polymerase sigma-70 factor (ECF subfamily)